MSPGMDTFSIVRALGCVVCGDPVSPCPSPACPPEFFGELAPMVYRSVLLSSSHPQFTRQELESKLRTGEIDPFQTFPLKNCPKIREERHRHKRCPVPADNDSMRSHPPQKTSAGFFSHLGHLQRQLVSGNTTWSRPTGRQSEEKPSKILSSARCETARNTNVSKTPPCGLFPPILNVWAQRDAMKRAIRLRI